LIIYMLCSSHSLGLVKKSQKSQKSWTQSKQSGGVAVTTTILSDAQTVATTMQSFLSTTSDAFSALSALSKVSDLFGGVGIVLGVALNVLSATQPSPTMQMLTQISNQLVTLQEAVTVGFEQVITNSNYNAIKTSMSNYLPLIQTCQTDLAQMNADYQNSVQWQNAKQQFMLECSGIHDAIEGMFNILLNGVTGFQVWQTVYNQFYGHFIYYQQFGQYIIATMATATAAYAAYYQILNGTDKSHEFDTSTAAMITGYGNYLTLAKTNAAQNLLNWFNTLSANPPSSTYTGIMSYIKQFLGGYATYTGYFIQISLINSGCNYGGCWNSVNTQASFVVDGDIWMVLATAPKTATFNSTTANNAVTNMYNHMRLGRGWSNCNDYAGYVASSSSIFTCQMWVGSSYQTATNMSNGYSRTWTAGMTAATVTCIEYN